MRHKMGLPGIGQVVAWATMIVAIVLVMGFPSERSASQALPGEFVLIDTVDQPLPKGIEALEVYDAFVLAQLSPRMLETLPSNLRVERLPDRTVVSLNGWVFDTLQGEPRIEAALRAAPDDPYFLVQFYGPIKGEWVSNLEAMGVTFLAYWPNYTYIVHMDPALMEKVQMAHAVQWVGHYHPAYRLASDEDLTHAQRDGERLAVLVSTFEGVEAKDLERRLETIGAEMILFEATDPPVARVWALREQLPSLATLPGVFSVEPYDPPQLTNDGSTQVMHTWQMWKASRNGLLQDLMGAGQVAGVLDSGLDDNTTSPNIKDFYDYTNGSVTSRVQSVTASAGCTKSCKCDATDDDTNGGHGTHVAGTIAGNGYLSLMQRGLTSHATSADPTFDYAFAAGQAPEANIRAIRSGGTTGGLCISAQTDWATLYNGGARVTNNSWGNTLTTYEGNARVADYIMWTYQDYLLVVSASNAGPGADTVAQPGTAKNILTVGAAGNHRSVWEGDSQTASVLTDFSSRGPITTGSTGDIRYKPDIVAPGADILSTRSTAIANTTVGLWQNEPGDGDSNGYLDYAWSGGTSMSAPNVTGAAIIVRDYYQDIQGLSNSTPPSAALLKATLLNGAVDMGYGYEVNTTTYPYGGRNMQGWGMVNLEQSLMPRAPRSFFYDDFTNINNSVHQSTIGPDGSGDSIQYTVVVADSSEPLKVTLTWTDFANATTSGYAVNNLNLLVTAPGGTQYLGNIFSGAWSTTGGTADTINNTEAVYVQNPAAGTWIIRVTLANAPTGSYQPYALFVSGGLGITPTTTRTCSGITSCSGRMGTSAQPYSPSLKPLAGTDEHAPAGTSFTTSFRVTNWGMNSDTIALSYAVTDMTGANATGITVSFDNASLALASGASQDVEVVVHVDSTAGTGPYDVALTATSAGTGNRKDVQVVALNVLPHITLSNETRVGPGTVSTTGAQVSPSFWVCPNTPTTMWVAYLDKESHTGSGAKVYAARSTDGGSSWTKWQVDSNDGSHYYPPAIGGSADCNSVTVAWVRGTSTVTTASYWLYSRTYSAGAWGAIGTRDSLANNANYYMADPAVIYDRDSSDAPDILLTWLHYDGSTATGIYYAVSNNGTWGSATNLVTGAAHRYPALTLDTVNNHVWMAFSYSGTTRDIYVRYWDGSTNTWNATNTIVANTGDRENHPAIFYANGALWVAWNRYTNYSNPTPRLYYVRTTSTLPAITWGTTYGPYGTRLAEHTPPSIVGNNSYTYIAYLAYNDAFRGANIHMLRSPGGGGTPDATYQISATVDDPPFNARGNAGAPRLQWATTTMNGSTFTGPTLLYSKNAPDRENPSYNGNLGVAQTLFNLEENFDFYMTQATNPTPRPITYADTQGRCAGNKPCYNTFQKAVDDVDSAGTVMVYPRAFNESLTINKNVTVNFVGGAGTTTTLNGLTLVNGTVNAPAGTLALLGDFIQNGGVFNHNSGTVAFNGTAAQTVGGTVNTQFYGLSINNGSGVTLNPSVTIANQLTLAQGVLGGTSPSLASGATIERSGGSLATTPAFGGIVNVVYTGSTAITTGPELPVSDNLLNNLTIAASGGVTLNAAATVNGALTLSSGLLRTGANTLTLGASSTIAGTPGPGAMIVTGSAPVCKVFNAVGAFTFPIGDETSTLEYSPATLDFTSGDFGPGQACVRVADAQHPANGSAAHYLTRYWTVTSSNISNFSANTAFVYLDADIVGTETSIFALKWDGGSWTTGGLVNADANQVEMMVSSFSDFTGGNTPTAVVLASFAAMPQGEDILVSWETAMELQNLGFNLYRGASFTGPWVKLNAALIPAQNPGAVFGASYEWLDTGLTPDTTYYYRLEDVDIHGASTFHGPVSATTAGVTAVSVVAFGARGAAYGLALALMMVGGFGFARKRHR